MKDRFDFIKVIIIHLEASLLLKEVSLPELNVSKLSSIIHSNRSCLVVQLEVTV